MAAIRLGQLGKRAALVERSGLAVQLGARLKDIADTVHAHPTFPEALIEASKAALGCHRPDQPAPECRSPGRPSLQASARGQFWTTSVPDGSSLDAYFARTAKVYRSPR